jgi:DNA-binding PadR family transcriptional regulator
MDISNLARNDVRRVRQQADPPALKPAVFHVLLALAERATHGYGAMQAVREQSGGRVSIGTASFYRHLARLIDDGLVVEAAERPADDDPRRGAYYRLSPRGLRVLAAERTRLAALVAAIDALTPARRGPA